MCEYRNPVMLRFHALLNGAPYVQEDRELLREHHDLLVDLAHRRGRHELVVMLELGQGYVSNAQYTAERYESDLSLEAKIRLFHAFREANDEVARILQHRWLLSKHLPKRYHR